MKCRGRTVRAMDVRVGAELHRGGALNSVVINQATCLLPQLRNNTRRPIQVGPHLEARRC